MFFSEEVTLKENIFTVLYSVLVLPFGDFKARPFRTSSPYQVQLIMIHHASSSTQAMPSATSNLSQAQSGFVYLSRNICRGRNSINILLKNLWFHEI